MRMPQFRLLPVTICVALMMFMVRANDIWRGVMSGSIGSAAHAQATPPQQPVKQATPQLAQAQPAPAPAPKKDAPAKPEQVAKAAEPVKKDGTKKDAAGHDGADVSGMSSSEIEVLQKLADRREELEARGRELDMREGLLKAAEARIDKKIGELKTLQGSIDALIKKHNEQEEAKMASLVKIYENMKPKDAARIFEQLDMPILLDVVERMSERKIAPILADMNPQKAKAVTSELAQRRQLPQPSATNG